MLPWLLDAAYLVFLAAVSPWLVYQRIAQKKPIAGLAAKLSGRLQRRHPGRPCLWFHAVSVGEVLQLRSVISRMQTRFPEHEFVITTTTRTGFDVAKSKYPHCTVCYFPLDFSWAVKRAMKSLKPQLIVLVELELWPNFLWMAERREVPVAIVNGRISESSFRIYRRFRWLVRPLLESCCMIAVQSPANAERFLDLGAPPARLFQTGNIKFDGVESARDNVQTEELRRSFGIAADELVFLAGSTQAPEEELAIAAWERLCEKFPKLRLLLVPRHKERFEEAAELVKSRGHGLLRRSRESRVQSPESEQMRAVAAGSRLSTLDSRLISGPQPVLLLDTLGELSHAWGLADIAFVGGSLTDRGGQNMIEPAAYGAAVLFGPNTWNFRDITEALLARDAARVIQDAGDLTPIVHRLLSEPTERARLGNAARQFVLSQQGATDRTIQLLVRVMGAKPYARTASDKAA